MAHDGSPVIDTQVDPPNFVPHSEHQAVMAVAREAVRERDQLVAELTRMRRESEMPPRLRREYGDFRAPNSAGFSGTTELREALEQREREIRKLKDSNVAREKLLVDAREKIAALTEQKSMLETRQA